MSEKEPIWLSDIIEESAKVAITQQHDDGSFPPGRNYTYDEPETPVRTTSHWLQILTKAYEITGMTEFKHSANRAIDYLLSDKPRPYGFTYHCRNVESKDKCNGLVGQAAPILALIQASEVLGRQDAEETATEVFLLHPFSEELGLWERVEIDGRILSFDRTLNHQIIFAAAASELSSVDKINDRIAEFLDNLQTNMRLHGNGLIKHYVRPSFIDVVRSIFHAPRRRYDMLLNEIVFHYYSYSKNRRMKERGYQTVNLTALSRLQSSFPNHSFWDCKKLSRALGFIQDHERELITGVETKHGNPLQSVGIAKIRHRLKGESIEELTQFLLEDLSIDSTGVETIFDIDGVDKNTQAALVSALIDLPNVKIR